MTDIHCPLCAAHVDVPVRVAQVRCAPDELVVMFSDMHVAHRCPNPNRDAAEANEIAALRASARRLTERYPAPGFGWEGLTRP